MKITFYYQFYQKHNISFEDYFFSVLSSVDPEYRYTKEPIKTIHLPINPLDPVIQEKGLMTLSVNGTICCVIKELEISIDNIVGDDKMEVVDHLVQEFGDKATAYKLEDEVFLNQPE